MDASAIGYAVIESPVGPLLFSGDERGLRGISFAPHAPRPGWRPDRRPVAEAIRQIEAYFAAELRDFDLPLAPQGTDFQLTVWKELRRIPYGATISYGELALRIEKPKASRAVGAANGANPIPIVIPCHRVIGTNGTLTGYGGGLPIKTKLLDLERD
jgi:methylated-DNA-[protein]-cysteine S-methyltransferase